MLTWYVRNSASKNNGANIYLLLLNFSDEKIIVLLFYIPAKSLFIFSEEQLVISFCRRNSPFFRDEFPLMHGMRMQALLLFDILHQIVAQIFIRCKNNALRQILFCNSGSYGK